MAKNESPSLPSTPTYAQDPLFRSTLEKMSGLGTNLTSLDFANNPLLAETIQMFNPEMSNRYANTLRTSMTPAYESQRQDLINTLAANNQLEGSTTGNVLQKQSNEFLNTLTSQTGQFDITNAMNALQNRVNLFNTGVGLTQNVAQLGQGNEQALNQFNLSNYENQVAQQMYKDQNKAGGFMGALTGGLGGAGIGAALGLALALPTGGLSIPMGLAYGAAAGGLVGGGLGAISPKSTSNTLLQGGVGALGYSAGSMLQNPAGSTAGVNLRTGTAEGNTFQDWQNIFRGLNA